MAVLSVMKIKGDTEELLQKMQQTIAPVAERKAPEYGGISSTVVKTDEGIMIVNLWETEEGRQAMSQDPEVRQALKDSGYPEPGFKGYEVLMHRQTSEIPAQV